MRIRVRAPQEGDTAEKIAVTFLGEAEAMVDAKHDPALVQKAMVLALTEFASERGSTLHALICSIGASWEK